MPSPPLDRAVDATASREGGALIYPMPRPALTPAATSALNPAPGRQSRNDMATSRRPLQPLDCAGEAQSSTGQSARRIPLASQLTVRHLRLQRFARTQ